MDTSTDAFAEALSVWFERARKRANLSKPELAQRAGVALDTIYRIADGRGGKIGQDKVNAIANALAVPPPTIGRVLLLAEAPQEPQTARQWIAEAQVALERADDLLAREEPTRQGPDAPVDLLTEAEGHQRRAGKHLRPHRKRKRA